MTKQELLKKLTNEELKFLSNITSDDIKNEMESRNIKDVEIGSCFCFKYEDVIFLIKVINLKNALYVCEEISIESDNTTDIYTSGYCYDDIKSYTYINPEFYTKVVNILKEKQEAIDKIIAKFDNNIVKILKELKDYVDC